MYFDQVHESNKKMTVGRLIDYLAKVQGKHNHNNSINGPKLGIFCDGIELRTTSNLGELLESHSLIQGHTIKLDESVVV